MYTFSLLGLFPIQFSAFGRTAEHCICIHSEYRDRCELYAQEIWVCQCTGHTGLTHKEAWDSEHKIRNMLEASFPEFLHKPILSAVHHCKFLYPGLASLHCLVLTFISVYIG